MVSHTLQMASRNSRWSVCTDSIDTQRSLMKMRRCSVQAKTSLTAGFGGCKPIVDNIVNAPRVLALVTARYDNVCAHPLHPSAGNPAENSVMDTFVQETIGIHTAS